MKNYVKQILHKLILAEKSPTTLALSFSLGAFLAFSPYLGLQTWLVFPLCWILKLNITVTMTTLYLISNPLTFVPIVLTGYWVGQWFLIKLLKIDAIAYNPTWLSSLLNFLARYVIDLQKYLGFTICFWCFFIGAHIVGILIAILLYPIMKHVFSKLLDKYHGTDYENYYSK